MPVDDGQFNLLMEKLGVPDGGLSYLDFVATLEGKVTLVPMQHEKILLWKILNFSFSRKYYCEIRKRSVV